MTTTTSTLTTIGLDELIALDSLQTRVDRKYALTSGDAAMALALVGRRLHAGARDRRGDRPGLHVGVPRHRRARHLPAGRTRPAPAIQGAQPNLRVQRGQLSEVKTRRGDRTVKDRLPGQHVQNGRLGDEGAAFVARTLRLAGYAHRRRPHTLGLATGGLPPGDPVSRTDRVAGDDRFGPDLVGHAHRGLARPSRPVDHRDQTTGRAVGMDRLLWSMGHRPDRISKYATGAGGDAPAPAAEQVAPGAEAGHFVGSSCA